MQKLNDTMTFDPNKPIEEMMFERRQLKRYDYDLQWEEHLEIGHDVFRPAHMEKVMRHRLATTVFGENAGRKHLVRYPEDWWQAFKDRWFPRWAKRRWPVLWHEDVIEFRRLFPDIQVPYEQEHAYIIIQQLLNGRPV